MWMDAPLSPMYVRSWVRTAMLCTVGLSKTYPQKKICWREYSGWNHVVSSLQPQGRSLPCNIQQFCSLSILWDVHQEATKRNTRTRCRAVPTKALTENLHPSVPRDECPALPYGHLILTLCTRFFFCEEMCLITPWQGLCGWQQGSPEVPSETLHKEDSAQ